ncbi:MAG: hypothetical protein KAR20_25930 [Candidatus Heimdallarchaeota archaeon]|nr:hypothetical protein [Candidatus Heimdallarchaeota archaeon]
MELTKIEREKKERAEKLVREIAAHVNTMSFKPNYFIEAMSREHRTLQQSFVKLCMQWLEYVASDEYRYDGRNEASHDICKELLKRFTLGNHDINPSQFLPLI